MEKVNKQKRYNEIRSILSGGKLMTAKEIAVAMFEAGYTPTTERNFASPRINELMEMGEVEPIRQKKCQYTGKTVWIYALTEEYQDGEA